MFAHCTIRRYYNPNVNLTFYEHLAAEDESRSLTGLYRKAHFVEFLQVPD